jgi:hypothetical protein
MIKSIQKTYRFIIKNIRPLSLIFFNLITATFIGYLGLNSPPRTIYIGASPIPFIINRNRPEEELKNLLNLKEGFNAKEKEKAYEVLAKKLITLHQANPKESALKEINQK